MYVSHLCRGFNIVKTFEDLVLEYDIPITDRHKYDSLMNALLLDWFTDPPDVNENVFDKIIFELVRKLKVPKYAYSLLRNKDDSSQDEVENEWEVLLGLDRNDIGLLYIKITSSAQ